jgi:hypothetical protein
MAADANRFVRKTPVELRGDKTVASPDKLLYSNSPSPKGPIVPAIAVSHKMRLVGNGDHGDGRLLSTVDRSCPVPQGRRVLEIRFTGPAHGPSIQDNGAVWESNGLHVGRAPWARASLFKKRGRLLMRRPNPGARTRRSLLVNEEVGLNDTASKAFKGRSRVRGHVGLNRLPTFPCSSFGGTFPFIKDPGDSKPNFSEPGDDQPGGKVESFELHSDCIGLDTI